MPSDQYAGFCFVPEGLALPDGYPGAQCPSPNKILTTFLLWGGISVFFNLIFGFDPARRFINLWDRVWHGNSYEYSEEAEESGVWPGIITVAIHIAFVLITVGIVMGGGFTGNFGNLFLLWITRPRFGFLATVVARCFSDERYNQVVVDQILAEAILQVIAIPFGTKFIDGPRRRDHNCDQIDLTAAQMQQWSKMTSSTSRLIS